MPCAWRFSTQVNEKCVRKVMIDVSIFYLGFFRLNRQGREAGRLDLTRRAAMCQSYRKACLCGQQTSEIFFGKYVLDERAVAEVYCPECSRNVDRGQNNLLQRKVGVRQSPETEPTPYASISKAKRYRRVVRPGKVIGR